MPTTPGGLPYPSGTDPVANGAQDIQDLAEAVEANSGLWKIASGTATLSTSATNITGIFSSQYSNYRVILNMTASSTTNNFIMRPIVGTTTSSASCFQSGTGALTSSNTLAYYTRANGGPEFPSVASSLDKYVALDFFNPNKPVDTFFTGVVHTDVAFQIGGRQTSALQNTRLQLVANTGTMALSYYVYGYRD